MLRKAPIIAALALIAGTSGAMAQTGITSWTATCAQVQGAVARNGSAVVTFSPARAARQDPFSTILTLGSHSYDKVVLDQRYCLPRQGIKPIWVPTRDVEQCFAGYTCNEDNGSNRRGGR